MLGILVANPNERGGMMKQKKRQDEGAERLEKRPTDHIGSLLLYIQVDEVLRDKQDQRICKITIKADSLQQLDCRVPEKRFVYNPCLRKLEEGEYEG